MIRVYCLFLLFISVSSHIQGQVADTSLKVLGYGDWAIWKSISEVQLSADGRFTSYRLVPGEGDPLLTIHDAKDGSNRTIARVSRSQFDYDTHFVFGIITPHRDSLRALERKKVEKKKWPSDTLFIENLDSATNRLRIPHVTQFSKPEKFGGWISYMIKADAIKAVAKTDTVAPDSTKTEKKEGSTDDKKKKSKKDITHLIIRQLSTGKEDTLRNVKEYIWSDRAPVVLAITQSEDSTQIAGVAVWKDHTWTYLKKEKGEYSKLSIHESGKQLAFLGNLDTTKAQVPPYQLFYYNFQSDSAQIIASKIETSLALPPTFPLVAKDTDLRWSEDGRYLFYGRAEMPEVKDTSLLADEIVNVEVWGTEDPSIYPVQKVRKPNEEKKAYAHAFDTQTGKHTSISNLNWENAAFNAKRKGRFAVLYTEKIYEKTATWLSDAAKDLAIVDIQTGKITPFKKEMYTNPRLSPAGSFAFGYSDRDSTWWTYQVINGVFTLMNRRDLPTFFDEENDTPGYPSSYGVAGWTTDDQSIILYDRYDLWSWSPMKARTPVRLTRGRENKIVYRYIRTDPEEQNISSTSPWLLHAMNDIDKSSDYVWFNPTNQMVDTALFEPYSHTRQVTKSREGDVYIFTKENFREYPDLRRSTDRLASSAKISDANPQIKEYKWGTIELYQWMDWDSVMRTGLLIKPDGFDSLRSYPTIVNFYEKSSNDLHNHPHIFPHRSTINYAFYASRGYVIFNPDISYIIGKPGESAYQIVMSGVTSLMKRRIADSNKLALQGHSWGGYQIAYIVSRTNMFKCAEAGAAVVNMTSAYGGIRGESGRARMFQYEQEQSRLGKTLWEEPQLYIANSPLFNIDKIETPLLLMHNDNDGAVPFQQGIEFYLALRRNGKQAWLLNYPGEPHWPTKLENRKDFQTRMSEFFDHYLLDKPMPEWMKGVPLVKRGSQVESRK